MSGTTPPHPGALATRLEGRGLVPSDGPSGDSRVDDVIGRLTTAIDAFVGDDDSATAGSTTPGSAPGRTTDSAAHGDGAGGDVASRPDAAAVVDAATAAHDALQTRLRQADVG